MELRQIKYFVEVAKNEHVTQAAERLHVAQSAVSRQISNLEDELGVKLFIRKGRNVKLTPIGKVFLQRAQMALAEIDQAVHEIRIFLHSDVGEVRIGFPNSLAAYTLPNVVSAFRKKHPNIQFQLIQGTVTKMIEDMTAGEIDLAFVSPVPDNHPDVIGYVFFREEMKVILPADHPLAHLESIQLNQLKDEPFVMFREGFIMRTIVMEACAEAGFVPKIAFEGEDSVTIRGLVGAGLGVGILPSITLSDKDAFKIVTIKINNPVVTRTVGFVTPRHRQLAPSEKLFQDFLCEYYANTFQNQGIIL